MLEKATVMRVRNAPASLALDVKLSSRSDGIRESGKRNGIGMQWSPTDFRPANSACLRYSVQMAEDFEYGKQGILPGLYGGRAYDTSKPSDGKNGFAARLAWRADRTAEVVAQLPTSNGPDGTPIDGGGLYLPRGQWVSIEQEVVLNTPGKQDGILRVWADGRLKIERKNIEYRRDENLRIDGVLAHIDHGSVQRPMPPARETSLKVTPFLLSWQ
jgi:hypothetical protein